MTTLIIPCSGKSSRFPSIRPKWLFTHPNGELMIERAIRPFENKSQIKKKIITITRQIDKKFNAKQILNQAFGKKVEVLILKNKTKSASETVFKTIKSLKIAGQIIVKDSDNFFEIDKKFNIKNKNFVFYADIEKNTQVQNIHHKSFLLINNKNQILNIEEKKVVSEKICVGIYSFKSVNDFKKHYNFCKNKFQKQEIFISFIVKSMLAENNLFLTSEVINYEDYGSFSDWLKIRARYRTYFVDLDGVIFINKGKYGKKNWNSKNVLINENIETLKKLNTGNAQIIFTTSRPDNFRNKLLNEIRKIGFKKFKLITGLNHGQRIIINDYSTTNPNPTALSINLHRNSNKLKDLIESY
jgi:hypothetical protein